jgi:hypothetical protein
MVGNSRSQEVLLELGDHPEMDLQGSDGGVDNITSFARCVFDGRVAAGGDHLTTILASARAQPHFPRNDL